MTTWLAISSILSRLLGVVRQNRFADMFGAGGMSDAYFAAFTIPDFLYSVIVYGALSAAFVPIFTRYLRDQKRQEIWEFTSAVLKAVMGIVCLASILLFLLAPWIITLLYPGFAAEIQAEAANLMRIMLFSLIFFSFSAIFSSIQTAYRQFIFYGLAPIVYNLSIIAGIVLLGPVYGIYGVAYGVVIGAVFHALIQLPAMKQVGFQFFGRVSVLRHDMKALLRMSIPRILGLVVLQINILIEGMIVSLAGMGALSILRYAQDIQSFPIGVIGLSVAVSSFATLSDLALKGDGHREFVRHLSENMKQILALVIPASFGLFLLREPLTRLTLESGAFSSSDTFVTMQVISILCVSLFAASLIPLLSRAFFSLHDTRHPLYLGIAAILFNVALSLALVWNYGVIGVAMASALSSILYFFLLAAFLKRKIPVKFALIDTKSTGKILLASLCMSFIVAMAQSFIPYSPTLSGLLLYLISMGGLGVTIYCALAHSLGLKILPPLRFIRSRP